LELPFAAGLGANGETVCLETPHKASGALYLIVFKHHLPSLSFARPLKYPQTKAQYPNHGVKRQLRPTAKMCKSLMAAKN
jgi:hypothetical protein